MAKGIYVGVGNTAKKVSKTYVGVDGIARKISKGYIGVGGVARPFYSAEPIMYYGEATPMSVGRASHAAAHVGSYGLFAGGHNFNDGFKRNSSVDAYNMSLLKSTPADLSVARNYLSGASVGDYALFAGGSDADSNRDTVDAYNSSLIKSTPQTLAIARNIPHPGGASVGNHALFAGYKSGIDAFNSSLVRTIPQSLINTQPAAGISFGNYALFGADNAASAHTATSILEAYNSSLIRSTPTALSHARSAPGVATTSSHALFAGGVGDGDLSSVDAYNSSLTRTTPMSLSSAGLIYGTSLSGFAIFYCGHSDAYAEVYNSDLVRTNLPPSRIDRNFAAAISIGPYALFSGGGTGVSTVNAYVSTL